MIILELNNGEARKERLTELQGKVEQLGEAMAGYISFVAGQDKKAFLIRERELRSQAQGPHNRTPENIASIQLGIENGLRFAVECGAIKKKEAEEHRKKSWEVLLKLAGEQALFLSSESPADRFINLIGAILASGRAHVTTVSGEEPNNKMALGWKLVKLSEEGEEMWSGMGRRIGWVDGDYLYLDPEVAYSEAQDLARAQNASLEVTQETL